MSFVVTFAPVWAFRWNSSGKATVPAVQNENCSNMRRASDGLLMKFVESFPRIESLRYRIAHGPVVTCVKNSQQHRVRVEQNGLDLGFARILHMLLDCSNIDRFLISKSGPYVGKKGHTGFFMIAPNTLRNQKVLVLVGCRARKNVFTEPIHLVIPILIIPCLSHKGG